MYPTLVIRGTGLYELWKRGAYQNYHPATLVDLVARVLSLLPPWVRAYRIQRDIPMPLVSSGVEKGNLRELALARMGQLGLRCRDVRTREAGIQDIHSAVVPENVELVRRDYAANGGWETFLAYEDPRQDILVALLRLRKVSGRPETRQPQLRRKRESGGVGGGGGGGGATTSTTMTATTASTTAATSPSSTSSSLLPPPTNRASIVRELHVYGTAIAVHARDSSKHQHQGYGALLMEEAERIARVEHRSKKLSVISGVGTRGYYRKLGFELDGPYMSKAI